MSRRKEKKRNLRSDKILFPQYQTVTTAKQTEPGEDEGEKSTVRWREGEEARKKESSSLPGEGPPSP
jgi:hypothetical protein